MAELKTREQIEQEIERLHVKSDGWERLADNIWVGAVNPKSARDRWAEARFWIGLYGDQMRALHWVLGEVEELP